MKSNVSPPILGCDIRRRAFIGLLRPFILEPSGLRRVILGILNYSPMKIFTRRFEILYAIMDRVPA